MAPEKISAFEARRRENVAKNAELLKDTEELGAKMRKTTVSAPRPVSTRKRKAAVPAERRTYAMPTRQSARLAGANKSESSDPLVKLEDTPVELKDREPKRARTDGDLALSDLKVEGKRWSNVDALESLKQATQPGVRTFTDDDINDTTDEKLKTLRQDLSELKLYEGWQPNDIKLTPERIYSLTFHPVLDKPLVFAGDKKGTLGFFDASQKMPDYPEDEDEEYDVPLPVIGAFEVHTRTLTSIKIPVFDQNSVITSSYDCSIRSLDLQTQVSTQLWAPDADEDESDLGISCIDISAEAKDTVVFSTLKGFLGRIDRRSKSKAEMWRLTENKIGGFSLNPLAPHLVATGSLDRTLKIWDLRMIKGKTRNDPGTPSLLAEHVQSLSVSHASWNRAGQIATSSYDDTVKIYDMSDFKPGGAKTQALRPSATVRHNNQSGRWVTILKPQWQANPGDGVQKLVIASMNRFLDVYDAQGAQLAQLDGDGVTAVPAAAEFHPVNNWVAGGTSSGKLALWR
ncbi:WD40-repeat-containing domain protein [Xylariaceae sp. FL0594]|nr:WD40-repeat-containing domain protein [Xylariaceae sp. FL0594]